MKNHFICKTAVVLTALLFVLFALCGCGGQEEVEPDRPASDKLVLNYKEGGKAWVVARPSQTANLSESETKAVISALGTATLSAGTPDSNMNMGLLIDNTTVLINSDSGRGSANGKVFALDTSSLLSIKSVFKAHSLLYDDPTPEGPDTDEPGTDSPGTDDSGNEPGTDEPSTDEPSSTLKFPSGQNYDFVLNLRSEATISGFTGYANANYTGKHRTNPSTGKLEYCHKTGGLLLYDTTKYIFTRDLALIAVTANESDIKNVEVLEGEFAPICEPLAKFVASVSGENSAISQGDADYSHCALLNLSSNNALISLICDALNAMDTSIAIKNVTFTNPVNGIKVYYNANSNGNVTSCKLEAQVSVVVKGTPVLFTLTYEHTPSDTSIALPNISDIYTSASDISGAISAVNNAVSAAKNSTCVSLDVSARNEFDPGATTLATVDEYTARFFRNGNAFNLSYKYAVHTQSQGKETYKYTLGNLQDGSVYLVSRKGKNRVTAQGATSAGTVAGNALGIVSFNTSHINCISKKTVGGETVYRIFLNKSGAAYLQQAVLAAVNGCNESEVLKAQNYFNNNFSTDSAVIEVSVKGGMLSYIDFETDYKYVATSGTYSGKDVTLTSALKITVNEELDKAGQYEAPAKAEGTLIKKGLDSSSYYIL